MIVYLFQNGGYYLVGVVLGSVKVYQYWFGGIGQYFSKISKLFFDGYGIFFCKDINLVLIIIGGDCLWLI